MKRIFHKAAIAALFLCITQIAIYAQHPMTSLDAIWKKATFGPGLIRQIKPTDNGTYVAAGQAWNDNSSGADVKKGLIVEFDESGNTIRSIIVPFDQSKLNYTPANNGNGIKAHFRFAFKTPDGGYIAFGQVIDANVSPSLAEFNWSTGGRGPDLTNGVWVVRISAAGVVTNQRIDRGRYPSDGYKLPDGSGYIVVGCDRSIHGYSGNRDTDNADDRQSYGITMLRKYTLNGNNAPTLAKDKRVEVFSSGLNENSHFREIEDLYQDNDNKTQFVAISRDYMFNIDASPTGIFSHNNIYGFTFTALSPLLRSLLPQLPSDYTVVGEASGYSITPSTDGYYFIGSRLNSVYPDYGWWGNALFRAKFNGTVGPGFAIPVKPIDKAYLSPLRMQPPIGAPTGNYYYLGALRQLAASNGDFSTNDTYRMYGLTQTGSTVSQTPITGAPYPYGSSLKIAGLNDGFFAGGMTRSTDDVGYGKASIVKLSTCANFKLNINGSATISLPTLNNQAIFQGRTTTFTGQTGSVRATCIATDLTPGGGVQEINNGNGGSLPIFSNITVSGNAVSIPSKQYSLKAGQTFAIVQYTITITDQSNWCQQTQSITLFIYNASPSSREYFACDGATVVIGFNAVTGVKYNWYNASVNGSIVTNGANVNTLTVIKDGSGTQEWWAEPHIEAYGWTLPRVHVTLNMGGDCQPPYTACATAGTLLWKEDFDSYGNANDVFSQTGLASDMTGYRFARSDYGTGITLWDENTYALAKHGVTQTAWAAHWFMDDHTSQNDPNTGRMFIANGNTEFTQLYKQKIGKLCAGLDLNFSFWTRGCDAQMRWRVFTVKPDKTIDDVLATFYAKPLMSRNAWDSGSTYHDIPHNDDNRPAYKWLLYGFKFSVPTEYADRDIYFDVWDISTIQNGNDFAIDDIEVRLCSPTITVSQSGKLCDGGGGSVTLTGTVSDGNLENPFSNPLIARWYRIPLTGNPYDESQMGWSIAQETSFPSTAIPTLTYSATQPGYYRLAIADEPHIGNYNCRSMSNPVKVETQPCLAANNDYYTVQKGYTVDINVLANDQPSGLTASSLSFSSFPSSGDISMTGNNIRYSSSNTSTPAMQLDSFEYKVAYNGAEQIGKVYVCVLDDENGSFSCGTTYKPQLKTNTNIYNFLWYNDPGGSSFAQGPSPEVNLSDNPTTIYYVRPELNNPSKIFEPGKFTITRSTGLTIKNTVNSSDVGDSYPFYEDCGTGTLTFEYPTNNTQARIINLTYSNGFSNYVVKADGSAMPSNVTIAAGSNSTSLAFKVLPNLTANATLTITGTIADASCSSTRTINVYRKFTGATILQSPSCDNGSGVQVWVTANGFKPQIRLDGAGSWQPISTRFTITAGASHTIEVRDSLGCAAPISLPFMVNSCFGLKNDYVSVQKYHAVEIDALANDAISGANLNTLTITQPLSGTASIIGTGTNKKIIYVSNSSPATQIDQFTYTITNPSTGLPTSATINIYILEDSNGAAGGCEPYTPNLKANPAGVSFIWFASNETTQISAPSNISVTGELVYYVKPNITGYDYEKGKFTVYYTANSGDLIWTGDISNDWHNPRNWAKVNASGSGTTPVSYAPTRCTNVIIPSQVNKFPEITGTAKAKNITMKDRAQLKNQQGLINNYDYATVEIKLKPTELDRYVMWSAPLTNMTSGDYRYSATGGDVFMNYFQQANPDPNASNPQAVANRFTASFANTSQTLGLGRAFNLKVTKTTVTQDATLRFSGSKKFITDNISGNTLPVIQSGTTGSNNLLQVVNPYMAYLNFSDFYQANTSNIANGYYTWSGLPNDGFVSQIALENGNRYVANAAAPLSSTPELIPPLQSFIVRSVRANVTSLNISPNHTRTVADGTSYSLRSNSVAVGGVLHIQVSQNGNKAYAALVYAPQTSHAIDREDMPVIIRDDMPLAVYTFSAMNDALAVNSNEYFGMQPIKLGIIATAAGEVKLTFDNYDTFGHKVILQDKQTNKHIDISAAPSYTFTVAKAGEINDRFTMDITYTGQGITFTDTEATTVQPNIAVSVTPDGLLLRSNSDPIQSVEVYDMLGKAIYKEKGLNTTEKSVRLSSHGVHIVLTKVRGETFIEKVLLK
ncbi:MAG: hypothetical protein LBH04_10705 [Tannerellaceae bacterium]|jgi:hypothetical protein|nr:hypothetical protein [Tannerellaceae bacterium]